MSGRCYGAKPRTLLSQAEADRLAARVSELAGEPIEVLIGTDFGTYTQFARGDAHLTQDFGGVSIQALFGECSVGTNILDDDGVRRLLDRGREAVKELGLGRIPVVLKRQPTLPPRPKTFFESTVAAQAAERRADIYRRALDATEKAGLIGAGDLWLTQNCGYTINTAGLSITRPSTYGQFSLTARTKDGKGSGWGWSGHEDWDRVDVDSVIERAVDLAQRSANPVAVEPGRYTVILEPAATAELIEGINWAGYEADQGFTVFSKKPIGTNKLGFQMLDQRLGITTDPWDPAMPSDTINAWGNEGGKVDWFVRGLLKELYYSEDLAAAKGRQPTKVLNYGRYRLQGNGPTQTLEEMIASTKRGIWVNRLSGVFYMSGRTMLKTGTTRDGTFLIENGKITKAIKNFRFTESPFFVLNKLEAFGEPVRASQEIVAPRVKVRDFDFTSLTDAI